MTPLRYIDLGSAPNCPGASNIDDALRLRSITIRTHPAQVRLLLTFRPCRTSCPSARRSTVDSRCMRGDARDADVRRGRARETAPERYRAAPGTPVPLSETTNGLPIAVLVNLS